MYLQKLLLLATATTKRDLIQLARFDLNVSRLAQPHFAMALMTFLSCDSAVTSASRCATIDRSSLAASTQAASDVFQLLCALRNELLLRLFACCKIAKRERQTPKRYIS